MSDILELAEKQVYRPPKLKAKQHIITYEFKLAKAALKSIPNVSVKLNNSKVCIFWCGYLISNHHLNRIKLTIKNCKDIADKLNKIKPFIDRNLVSLNPVKIDALFYIGYDISINNKGYHINYITQLIENNNIDRLIKIIR